MAGERNKQWAARASLGEEAERRQEEAERGQGLRVERGLSMGGAMFRVSMFPPFLRSFWWQRSKGSRPVRLQEEVH